MAAPTVLTVQLENAIGGQIVTFVTADTVNGNQFPNNGKTTLLVKTSTAPGGVTVTIPSKPCAHNRSGDQVVVIASGVDFESIGPFVDSSIWGDANGNIFVNYSAF